MPLGNHLEEVCGELRNLRPELLAQSYCYELFLRNYSTDCWRIEGGDDGKDIRELVDLVDNSFPSSDGLATGCYQVVMLAEVFGATTSLRTRIEQAIERRFREREIFSWRSSNGVLGVLVPNPRHDERGTKDFVKRFRVMLARNRSSIRSRSFAVNFAPDPECQRAMERAREDFLDLLAASRRLAPALAECADWKWVESLNRILGFVGRQNARKFFEKWHVGFIIQDVEPVSSSALERRNSATVSDWYPRHTVWDGSCYAAFLCALLQASGRLLAARRRNWRCLKPGPCLPPEELRLAESLEKESETMVLTGCRGDQRGFFAPNLGHLQMKREAVEDYAQSKAAVRRFIVCADIATWATTAHSTTKALDYVTITDFTSLVTLAAPYVPRRRRASFCIALAVFAGVGVALFWPGFLDLLERNPVPVWTVDFSKSRLHNPPTSGRFRGPVDGDIFEIRLVTPRLSSFRVRVKTALWEDVSGPNTSGAQQAQWDKDGVLILRMRPRSMVDHKGRVEDGVVQITWCHTLDIPGLIPAEDVVVKEYPLARFYKK